MHFWVGQAIDDDEWELPTEWAWCSRPSAWWWCSGNGETKADLSVESWKCLKLCCQMHPKMQGRDGGREIYERYGPMYKILVCSHWNDVSHGFQQKKHIVGPYSCSHWGFCLSQVSGFEVSLRMHVDPEVALEERNPIPSIQPGAATGRRRKKSRKNSRSDIFSISIISWQEFIGIPCWSLL